MTSKQPTKHIEWMDGLKGLSALFVVLGHLKCAFNPILSEASMRNLHWVGFLGARAVPVFIVLSAIIMTIKCEDDSKWQCILIKRYFRLMLPCAVVLCLYWILSCAGLLYNNQLADILDNDWLRSSTTLNVKSCIKAIVFSPWGGGTEYLNILWMMKYMFITPFLVVLIHILFRNLRSWHKWFYIGLGIIAFYYIDPFYINIIGGYLIVNLSKEYSEKIGNQNVMIIIVALLLLMLVGISLFFTKYSSFEKGFVTTCESCLFVAAIYISTHLKKIFSIQPLHWLGNISFEIYLMHLLVIYTATSAVYIPPIRRSGHAL